MLDKFRIRLKTLIKGTSRSRSPETKFINPYAMSEPTTPQYNVKPEFKDGRFILKKEELMHEKKEKMESKEIELGMNSVADKLPVKKEPGFLKSISEVVASDMKSLSREERRKAKEAAQEEKEFKEYKLRKALQEKMVYDEFLKSREKHKKTDMNLLNKKDVIVTIPPSLELELLPAVELLKQTEKEVPTEIIIEPEIVMQPVHNITGNDITVSTIRKTLDRWKTFDPKVVKK